MAPQNQLSPREKYSVIRYIREHFIEDRNPDQLFAVTDEYLSSLPKGDQIGPEPKKRQPWSDMDYGPFLTGTFEIVPEETELYRWPEGN